MADGRPSNRVDTYVAAAITGPQPGEPEASWLSRLEDLWRPLDVREAQTAAERLRDRGRPASPAQLRAARQQQPSAAADPGYRHIAGDGELAAVIARAREAYSGRQRYVDPDLDAALQSARKATEQHDRCRSLMAYGIPEDAALVIAADAVEDRPAVVAVRRWVEVRPHLMLVLAGQKDASKTFAASLAVATWPKGPPGPRQLRGAWWELGEAPVIVKFSLILGPWYHLPTEARPVDPATRLDKVDLLRAKLLVLDDVGQEPRDLAERCGEALDQLLDVRAAAGLFTLLTTNYEHATDRCAGCSRKPEVCSCRRAPADEPRVKPGLLSRYGERGQRIGERILEHAGPAGWVNCPYSGYRRLKAPQKESDGT